MTGPVVLIAIAVVALFILTELTAAVLPVIVVLAMVPPDERHGLAEVLAAADSRRRLRLWRALRVAAKARRTALSVSPGRPLGGRR
jgi:hypothetical protein